jgi:hypothetical protein
MARKPPRPTWNDDLRRRLRFEREARERGLVFEHAFRGRPRRLIYEVPIAVPVYDERRRLRITLPPVAHSHARPQVLIDGPPCLRHRFDDDSLCMWWSRDSEDERWVPDDGLFALVVHATDHAYCEAECMNGRPWPKSEAPRRHREGCPTCRPLQ